MPLVEELTLNNFYNYYGEVSYEFEEGINIVIADNNGGKSKIYNAFLWILSDEVFDSDSRQYTYLNDPNNQFRIISDKAKYEADVGDKITTSVTLKFQNNLSQRDSGPVKYSITKSIIAEKLKENQPFSLDSWNIQLGTPKYIKTLGYDTQPIEDKDKQMEVSKFLLPESLKAYYMFQGEEITRLVGKELTNAVRKITNINKFDYLENYIDDICDKAESALNTRRRQASKKKSDAENSENELNRYKKIIATLSAQLKEKEEIKEEKEEKFDRLQEKVTEASRQYKLIQEIAKTENLIRVKADELNRIERGYNQNFFTNRWILEGVEERVNRFANLRDEYIIAEAQSKSEKFVSTLPHNIPDVPSLDKMINDKHCAVCNRSLIDDDEALGHLKNLRDRNKAKDSNNKEVNHLRVFLDRLFKRSDNLPREEELSETKDKIREKVVTLNQEIERLTEKANDLKEAQKQKDDDARKILDDHTKCTNDLKRLVEDITRIKGRLEGAKKEYQKEEDRFRSLEGADDIEPGYQNKVDILNDLKRAFTETKRKYYIEQADSLTQIINENYKKLTEGNQTNPGNVEIEVNDNFNFRSKMKNVDGGILTGQGSAFQRMKQLALLMGIVQIGRSQNYPLIADAPVSEMSSILTKNFFHCIPENFRQAIILVKDLIDDDTEEKELKLNKLGRDIMDNSYLDARIYINNAEGSEQHERETITTLISA